METPAAALFCDVLPYELDWVLQVMPPVHQKGLRSPMSPVSCLPDLHRHPRASQTAPDTFARATELKVC